MEKANKLLNFDSLIFSLKIWVINITQSISLIWRRGVKSVPIEDITALFNINNKKDIYRLHRGFEGEYATEIIRSFKRLGGKGKIINVGAAQGFYVIFSALAQNEVIAIEPEPEIFYALQKNVNLNGVGEKVQCLNCALGNQNRIGTLFTSGADGPAPNFNSPDDFKNKVEVPIFRMDNIIKNNPDILVIDVEGYEEKVMRGMGNLRPKEIFIEIHPDRLRTLGASEEATRKILDDYGYVLKNQHKRRKEFLCHFSLKN